MNRPNAKVRPGADICRWCKEPFERTHRTQRYHPECAVLKKRHDTEEYLKSQGRWQPDPTLEQRVERAAWHLSEIPEEMWEDVLDMAKRKKVLKEKAAAVQREKETQNVRTHPPGS